MSDPSPTPTPPAATPPVARAPIDRRRPRRRFRWYTRLLILVVLLGVAVVALAQALFWTDYPRRIVQAQIGAILHVDAKLGGLKIGWLGGVDVDRLSLQLPTEDAPFLDVEQAHLKLAPLWLIAFDQEVRDLRADGIDLAVRQQPNGRWNLEQLLESAAGPSPTPSQPTDPARVLANLPSVRLTNARVSVTKNDGKRLDLPDVRLTLDRPAPLTTRLDAHVGPEVAATGTVATLGTAPHSVTLDVTRPPPGLAAFLGADLPSPARARLTWTGRLIRGGVDGTLSVDDAAVAVAQAAGPVRVTVGGGGPDRVVVRPAGLTLAVATTRPATAPAAAVATTAATTRPAGPLEVRLAAGVVRLGDRLHVDGVRGVVNATGRFAVDGTFDPATLAGDVRAAWENVAQAGVTTSGSATLKTEPQFTGKLRVDAGLASGVTLPSGDRVGGNVALSGEGTAPDAFAGTVSIEPLTWTPHKGKPVVTPALVGDVALAGAEASLRGLRTTDPRNGTLDASAVFDRKTLDWWLSLDARGLRLPPIEAYGLKTPIDADVSIGGHAGEAATVRQLYARSGPGAVWASGFYDKDLPKPVRLETWAWFDKPATEDDSASAGELAAVGVIEGTLKMPLELGATMTVRANELVVRGRKVGDVGIEVLAGLDDERATLRSREMAVLGGTFSLDGNWDRRSDVPPTLTLNFAKIPVGRLADLAKLEDAEGMIDEGRAVVRVNLPPRLDTLEMDATARGTNLYRAPYAAETLTLAASLRHGEFRCAPILREGTGTLTAEVSGDVQLKNPVRLAVALDDWPAPNFWAGTNPATQPTTATQPVAAGGTATPVAATRPAATRPAAGERSRLSPRVTARANAAVALSTGVITGEAKMDAKVRRGDAQLADVRLDASVDDKRIALKELVVHTLDGLMTASGQADLANLNATTFDANFDRLAPAELAWLEPTLADFVGRVSGEAHVAPATGERPLGPVRLTLKVTPDADARFRSIALGPIEASAFADYGAPDRFRVVTDRATINVADGTVHPFGRFSMDPRTGPSQLLTVKFDRLDIDQLARAVTDDGKPVVGRLGGTARLYGPARSVNTIDGEATINITESDLANVGAVSALYNLMNAGTVGKDPTGHGTVNARIEADTLTVTDANYFNRGVYATAYGPVRGLHRLGDARIDKFVLIGSLKPFTTSSNSFFGDFVNTAGDTLAALQTSVAAVQVTGTVKEPAVKQVGLTELGDTAISVLLGKSKG